MRIFLKLFSVLVLSLVALGCAKSGKNTSVRSPSTLVSHMGDSTVALVLQNNENEWRVYCTAVWISEREILTANHCVEAAARISNNVGEDAELDPVDTKIHFILEKEVSEVDSEPTGIHLGTVKAVDAEHDLAIVVAKGRAVPEHAWSEVATEMPALGEHVYIVGHVKGLYWSFIEGVVSAYRKELTAPGVIVGPFVQVSAPVYFGNSGGGVFDSEGKLVGIASFIGRAPNNGFFIHADSIRRFLKQ